MNTDELKRLMGEAGKRSPLPWSMFGCSLYDAHDYKLADYLDPPESALIVAAVNALSELLAMTEENARLREALRDFVYAGNVVLEYLEDVDMSEEEYAAFDTALYDAAQLLKEPGQ
jgi:hypothetical protein